MELEEMEEKLENIQEKSKTLKGLKVDERKVMKINFDDEGYYNIDKLVDLIKQRFITSPDPHSFELTLINFSYEDHDPTVYTIPHPSKELVSECRFSLWTDDLGTV